MWESPVNIFEIREPIVEEINKQTEEVVFKAIHKVGVDVNKEELLKALQYDRNQYEKGYADGYADAIDEFAERLKEEYKPCKETDGEIYEAVCRRIDEIAEQMKGGDCEEVNLLLCPIIRKHYEEKAV